MLINAATDLYCVLGSPVSHSQSPLVHNTNFRENKINAVYLAFEPPDIKSAIRSIRTLDIKGVSVTIPFKETIMEYLDEIDLLARKIGAVNTVVNRGGRLFGYNTDCQAAVAPLIPMGIKDKTICIIGAGGAGKAVAHGIAELGGHIIITNRSVQKGIFLAETVGGQFIESDQMEKICADVVINTTSCGMEPRMEELPFPIQNLIPGMVVMDVVYTPLNTAFLSIARQKGCKTIDGLSMFVAQAGAQFELWTGLKPDTKLMRDAVLENQR